MISVRDITLAYGERILCSGLSLTLAPGETVVLAGANGSGKSTLLRRLSQLPGTVLVPTGIPKVRGFTLREFIRTGCYRISSWSGGLDAAGEKALEDALELLGIAPLGGRDIATLSDGEFQKGCIASALVLRAELLLLDEPTAFLDVENRVRVLRALRELARTRGIAVLFSSHELHESLAVADRVFAFCPDGVFRCSDATDDSRRGVLRAAFPGLPR